MGNKYVMIFSGYSGKEYGLDNTNSTLRYAYGDTPLGPWRSGGVLVDSRGVVLNEDGSALTTTNAGHNTHGSLQEINGQWYVFYHRPPRGFGFARQAMVAPVTIEWDEVAVADGGKVVIRGYDPYAPGDGAVTAKAGNGMEYTGAEVTSEGFQIYGLDPHKYYSAGYACYMSNGQAMQDAWDIWDNNMPVVMNGDDVVGFKYFGFGGLKKAQKGLKPFAGTKKGDKTMFNLFLTPLTNQAFTIDVMLDGPWDNTTWKGRKIAELNVPAGKQGELTALSADVAKAVEGLKGKHGIYLVARGPKGERLCSLRGLGFSRKGETMEAPVAPVVKIQVDGKEVKVPATPVRMNAMNGYTGYDHYEVAVPVSGLNAPRVTASASDPAVKVEVIQPVKWGGEATVKCDYNGAVKTYHVKFQ